MAEARQDADYFSSIHVTAGPQGTGSTPAADSTFTDPQVVSLLQTLAEQNRQLIQLSTQQLEISRRMEDRFEKQLAAQREEFVRWIDEIPGLSGRSKEATEALRNLLGRQIEELVDYVGEQSENMHESEYVQTEMVDRYGQLLNHLSAMYGMLKRLSTAEDAPRPPNA